MLTRNNPPFGGKLAALFPSFLKIFSNKPVLKTYILFMGMLLSFQLLSAQVGTVTGKVLSGDTAVPYVTVAVKGQKTATQTDKDGNFSIQAAANATLVVTAIGYSSLEVKVDNKKTVSVQLE